MADILIHGMEMPKSCLYCHFVSYDNDRCVVIDKDIPIYGTKPSWCHLVPLPEKHGRLGDLETAEAILHNKAFDLAGTSAEYNALIWAVRQIKALPTIVPAEGGTDNGF